MQNFFYLHRQLNFISTKSIILKYNKHHTSCVNFFQQIISNLLSWNRLYWENKYVAQCIRIPFLILKRYIWEMEFLHQVQRYIFSAIEIFGHKILWMDNSFDVQKLCSSCPHTESSAATAHLSTVNQNYPPYFSQFYVFIIFS